MGRKLAIGSARASSPRSLSSRGSSKSAGTTAMPILCVVVPNRSQPPKGWVMLLRLLCRRIHAMPALDTPTYTVALVEDEAVLRQEIAFQLQCLGFSVETFATASEFYRYLATRRKTIVVLDIGLEDGEDGLSICQHLRAHDPHIGIIFATARSLRSERLAGLDAGADAYLVKPVDIDELAMLIKRLGERLISTPLEVAAPTVPATLAPAALWQLEEVAPFLIAPNQVRIRLSLNEQQLLKALWRRLNQPCRHAELALALHLQPEEYSKHRIEVIFSRLRERVLRQSGIALPLQAERGVGYRLLIQQ